MYRINEQKIDKVATLLRQKRKLFHTNDLALIWDIQNPNTLYTTIKRYVHKEILIPIHKGFYATDAISNIDPIILGIGYLHTYAYLSCETVLADEGILFQNINYITLVSQQSKKFSLAGKDYLVRKMADKYLFQTAGITEAEGIKKATVERAVADLLYFNSRFYFDQPKAIDWKKVRLIQKEVGFK